MKTIKEQVLEECRKISPSERIEWVNGLPFLDIEKIVAITERLVRADERKKIIDEAIANDEFEALLAVYSEGYATAEEEKRLKEIFEEKRKVRE